MSSSDRNESWEVEQSRLALVSRIETLLDLGPTEGASQKLSDARRNWLCDELELLLSDCQKEDGDIEGWSARNEQRHNDEKKILARHFVEHDFLVPPGKSAAESRETVASIFVNQGTTPKAVVEASVMWIRDELRKKESRFGPFDITWFTPGGAVPAKLRDCRANNRELKTATKVFLFPGMVDQDQEAVSGPEPVAFAESLNRGFTYMFLGVYSLDLNEGNALFHYSAEVPLQAACSKLFADHKFVFLDSSKFRKEGAFGYSLESLLRTANSVSIYTESSSKERDDWISERFELMCNSLFRNSDVPESGIHQIDIKVMRLQLVGKEGQGGSNTIVRTGPLNTDADRKNGETVR